MKKNSTFHKRKVWVVFLLCAVMMLGLAGRLVYLMGFKSDYYYQKAQDLHERERSIKAARGKIVDAKGNILASNKTVCTVSVIHSQIKEPEKRTISLNIHQAMGFVSICMENYYTGEIRLSHGLPQTSTHDEAYHGYGVKSMQYIAEKYHGTLQIKTDQNIFTLNILLPI